MPLSFSHNTAARVTTLNPGAKLHYARGEVISAKPYSSRSTPLTLATGDQLLFCAKGRNVRDADRLVLVTLTDADWDADAAAYVQEFSGRTAPIAALLGITGSGSSNDVPSTIIDCNVVYIPNGEDEQVGDTFPLTLECPTYDPDDVLPDAADDSGIISARYEAGEFILNTEADGDVVVGAGGGVTASGLAAVIHAATAKATPVDADEFTLADSAATYGLKKTLWSAIKATLKTYFDTLYAAAASLATHIADTANPHAVTKTQVGLGNADNTSDADKPVSTAQQTALDAKASASSVSTHIADTANPHAVTKTQVGLSAVTNDAQLKIASNLSDLNSASAARSNLGLGTAATTAASDYATAAQGLLAEKCELQIACSDLTTDLTATAGVAVFRMPFAMTVTAVRASVQTAPTGSTLIVDINEAGSTILSTKLSIDASAKTSTTAASAAVISDAALADDAEITIDIDQIGASTAGKGLVVTLIGTRA